MTTRRSRVGAELWNDSAAGPYISLLHSNARDSVI
jgi:hypothetical protein